MFNYFHGIGLPRLIHSLPNGVDKPCEWCEWTVAQQPPHNTTKVDLSTI